MFSKINFVHMPHEGWMKNGSSFVQKWIKIAGHVTSCLPPLPFVKNTEGFVSSMCVLCFGQFFVQAPSC